MAKTGIKKCERLKSLLDEEVKLAEENK